MKNLKIIFFILMIVFLSISCNKDDAPTLPAVENVTVSLFSGSVAGNTIGTVATAKYNMPGSMAIAPDGTIYLADTDNHRIKKITPDGDVSIFAGSTQGDDFGVPTFAKFNNPRGIAIGPSGYIYVADTDNHKIKRIDPNTGFVVIAAGSVAGDFNSNGLNAKFQYPIGIVVDQSENIYVADHLNNKIKKIDSNGIVSTYAGSISGDYNDHRLLCKFNLPYGLAIDANNLYVTDLNNHKLKKINFASNQVTTVAGSIEGDSNGDVSTAKFRFPKGVAVGFNGVIYIADTENNKIKKISGTNVVTIAGKNSGDEIGSGASAKFNFPRDLKLDGSGNLYICDTGNHKIKKVIF